MRRLFAFMLILFSSFMLVSAQDKWDSVGPSFSSLRTNVGLKFGMAFSGKDYYDKGVCYGVSFNFILISNLSIELNGLRFTTEVTKSEENDLSKGTLKSIPLQLSIKYQFTKESKFVPYILTGADYILYNHTVDMPEWDNMGFKISEELDNGIGFHVGLGFDIFISENIALNIDGRYVTSKINLNSTILDTKSDVSVTKEIKDLKMDLIIATLGLKIYF